MSHSSCLSGNCHTIDCRPRRQISKKLFVSSPKSDLVEEEVVVEAAVARWSSVGRIESTAETETVDDVVVDG